MKKSTTRTSFQSFNGAVVKATALLRKGASYRDVKRMVASRQRHMERRDILTTTNCEGHESKRIVAQYIRDENFALPAKCLERDYHAEAKDFAESVLTESVRRILKAMQAKEAKKEAKQRVKLELDTSPASNLRRRAEMRELLTPTGTMRCGSIDAIAS